MPTSSAPGQPQAPNQTDNQDDTIETVEFAPGETLFREGDTEFHFYIIQDGDVEVYKTMATGKKLPLAIVSQGSALGEFAMFDRRPRSATARALTMVTAARIGEATYQKLIAELPEWALKVMGSLIDRLRQTSEILRTAGLIDPRVKEKIDSIEYVNDGGTTIGETPFLRAELGPGEDPEMV